MDPHASLLVTLGIGGIACIVAVLALLLYFRAFRTPRARLLGALVVASWMTSFFVLARVGFFADADARPPRFALIGVAALAGAMALSFSRVGARVASSVPLWLVVALMSFRLPLELVMHAAATEGVMPVRMSYGGANFDIVTGALALPIAVGWARGLLPRWALLAWNALGLVTVSVVMSIGMASSPLLHAFGEAPEDLNTWILHAPFIWLPTVLVVIALSGHLIVFRALGRVHLQGHDQKRMLL